MPGYPLEHKFRVFLFYIYHVTHIYVYICVFIIFNIEISLLFPHSNVKLLRYTELVLMKATFKFSSTQMKKSSQCLLILRATPGHLNLEFTIFIDLEILPKYLQEVRNISWRKSLQQREILELPSAAEDGKH